MSTLKTHSTLDQRFSEAREIEKAGRLPEAHAIYLSLSSENHWRSLYRMNRILLGIETQWTEFGIDPDHAASLRYLQRAHLANPDSHGIKIEYKQRTDKTGIEHQVLRRTHESSLDRVKSSFKTKTVTEEQKAVMLKKYLSHPEVFTETEQKWILKNCQPRPAERLTMATAFLPKVKEPSFIEMGRIGSSSLRAVGSEP